MTLFLQSIVLLLLFAASAFFAGSETALTALSVLKMKRLSVIRPGLSIDFSAWLAKPHRILITILVGNNVANMAISSLAATMVLPLAVHYPLEMLQLGVWLGAAAVLFIVGETMPKIIARAYRERITVVILPLLRKVTDVLFIPFAPLLWFLEKFAPGLETMPVNRLTAVSLEEVRHMISESHSAGNVPRESTEMMTRVLSLPQRTVAEIQQPVDVVDSVAVEVLDKGPNGAELFIDLLIETGRTRVPVTRGGQPVGYVLVMDLLKEWREGRTTSLEMLFRPAMSVSPDEKVFDLLSRFQKSGEHMFFVVGKKGKFLGVVTLEDALEEIVGEILDEYDLEKKKE